MRIVALLFPFLCITGALADPVREIEITSTPPRDGQLIMDVRLTPGQTAQYEKLTFECVLRQEFPSEATHRKRELNIHEPAAFTYRRKDVKMVEDLDTHINFKVPISFDRLVEIYGQTTFNTNFPVTVSRVVISAMSKALSWSYDIPANGVHRPPFPNKTASSLP